MNKLKHVILYSSFAALTFFSNNLLEAETAGQKLDKGIEKTQETNEEAKDKAEETYANAKENVNSAKDKAEEKYNEGLENAKTK